MRSAEQIKEQYGSRLNALAASLAEDDGERFLRELDELLAIRECEVFIELRQLTANLQASLERFRIDSRLVDLARKEMPDARHRLKHVLQLTEDAAHRTLDLVEQAGPVAERISKESDELSVLWRQFRARKITVVDFAILMERMDQFLQVMDSDMNRVRDNLAEVLLAQGYQDLTGQIIRGVMHLVTELELTLVKLVQLSSPAEIAQMSRAAGSPGNSAMNSPGSSGAQVGHAYGPTVPGVDDRSKDFGCKTSFHDQLDVDALLSGLGV
jgi:chemotaxis protein CheZ